MVVVPSTRVTRRVILVEQELTGFSGVRVVRSLVFYVVFCTSLVVPLPFFLLVIVLYVLIRFTATDYLPWVSLKLSFLHKEANTVWFCD